MLSKETPKHVLSIRSDFNPKSNLLCTAISFLKRSFMTSKNRGKNRSWEPSS